MSILMFEEMNKELTRDLINIDNNVSIISAFCKKEALEFLDKQIGEKQENKEIYFGELSAKIHNIIFQEPKQYRKDVKVLQVKLYNWIEKLDYDNLKIDIPNHSQRIRLIY